MKVGSWTTIDTTQHEAEQYKMTAQYGVREFRGKRAVKEVFAAGTQTNSGAGRKEEEGNHEIVLIRENWIYKDTTA